MWCGGSKHITLTANHTPLLWKYTQTIKPIFTWSKTDRWIVREGLKKEGEKKKWRFPYIVGFFEKRVGWLGRRVTVNGKKWTRFTGGCDRKRLFLTRRQSQSELQIHHFSAAGRRRGGRHLRIFREGESLWRVEKKREKEGFECGWQHCI